VTAAADEVGLTQQILQAADIVELVSRYVTLRRAGKDFKALCPFHNEKTPSFYVSPAKQIFKCFGCGVGGDAIKFLQLKENLTFLEARAMLAEQLGIRLEPARGRQDGPSKTDLAKVNAWAVQWFRKTLAEPDGESARQYLQKRGIRPESIEKFQIGYAPNRWDGLLAAARRVGISDRLLLEAGLIKRREGGGFYDTFRNRLMFPIVDVGGRVIAFGGRALDDSPAKYLNSPETVLFEKSSALFGLNLAREAMQSSGRALVVEGYTDCIACHQAGYGETVAVLGTALTDGHVQVLRRHVQDVILIFDGDEAGLRAADRSIEIVLGGQLEVRLAVLPARSDPADLLCRQDKATFEAALKASTGALEFRWERFLRSFGAEEAGAPTRRQAAEAFLRFLANMPAVQTADVLQRGVWAARVGKLLGMGPQEVQRSLKRLRLRPRAGRSVEPGSDPRESGSASRDAEQTALRQIVEVLINEPGYYDAVRDVFDPQQISDPELAEVARNLRELCESGTAWELTDLLARLPDARFGRLVTDLEAAGQRRGQYERTLDGAAKHLQHTAVLRRTLQAVQQLRSAGAAPDKPTDTDLERQLRKLAAEAKGYSHFAPPKWLTK